MFVVELGLPAPWCHNVEALDDHANHRRVMLRISVGRFARRRMHEFPCRDAGTDMSQESGLLAQFPLGRLDGALAWLNTASDHMPVAAELGYAAHKEDLRPAPPGDEDRHLAVGTAAFNVTGRGGGLERSLLLQKCFLPEHEGRSVDQEHPGRRVRAAISERRVARNHSHVPSAQRLLVTVDLELHVTHQDVIELGAAVREGQWMTAARWADDLSDGGLKASTGCVLSNQQSSK